MKVLVLGGSGYVGARLVDVLAHQGFTAVNASRRSGVDTRDLASMKRALLDVDAVVNCVAGSADAIAQGARVLVQAAQQSGRHPRIVHLSTMSVYGALEGEVTEAAPRDASIGWYAKAKCEAEDVIADYEGGVVMLRPGCVWGPGSELWVGRIGRLLRAGRLGDLGAAGDGWSNLVAVQDVCAAIAESLRIATTPGLPRVFNLAAPDSPRWNDYFVDLALAIGATPVARLSARRVKLDAKVLGPPLKVLEIAAKKFGSSVRTPDPIPPGLVGVFERHIHLRSDLAQQHLHLRWSAYERVLAESASWFAAAVPQPDQPAAQTRQAG